MSEYEGITGELRKYAALLHDKGSAALRRIEDMCDAIDAIHLQLELENAALRERYGWIELPKDADDKYIQPSDIPYLTKANDGKRLAYCPSLELRQDGTWRLAGWTPDRYRILKPTVEDVLREFGDWYAHTKGGCDEDGIIAEYAAKLRLSGDAE